MQEAGRGLSRREFLKLGGTGIAGAFLLGTAACGSGETIGGQQGGGGSVFTFGRGADSVGLDPINVTDGESFAVTRQIFDGLLSFEPGSTDVVPALATEVPEPEEDGTVYTFPLREGVEFHDGAPFNAEAVVFNFERWKDTGNEYHTGGGGNSSNFTYYPSMFGGFDEESVIESVEATGEHEVRFTLSEPQAPFLKNIAMLPFAIASPQAIKENVEEFWQNPVGTGPFTFDSWEPGSTVRLSAKQDWWGADLSAEEGGGGPNVDRVVFRAVEDSTARVASLTSGELSAADGLTPDDVPTIEESPDLKVDTRPPLNVGYLAMNNEKEPFNDPRVRRAVAHAIDMPKIVEAFFTDGAQVASNPMPPTVPFSNDDVAPYAYDPEEARRLLEEAGLGDGFEAEFWYMPVPRPYMPDGEGIAQAMQQDLREVGIRTNLVTFEFGTYLAGMGRGEHDMGLAGWIGDNGDPDNFLNVLLSSSTATETNAQNYAYYKNPEVDELLDQAQTTINEDERRRFYYQAQEIIHEDAPWAPIAYAEQPLGFQNEVGGYVPSPIGANERFNTVGLSGSGE